MKYLLNNKPLIFFILFSIVGNLGYLQYNKWVPDLGYWVAVVPLTWGALIIWFCLEKWKS